MIQSSPSSVAVSVRYTILVPSGDHVGSNPPSVVSCVRLLPSASLTQIPSSWLNAIRPFNWSGRIGVSGSVADGDESLDVASPTIGPETVPFGPDLPAGSSPRSGPTLHAASRHTMVTRAAAVRCLPLQRDGQLANAGCRVVRLHTIDICLRTDRLALRSHVAVRPGHAG